MSDAMLERRYRRLLRWYPRWFRDDIEDELVGVLLAGARDGQRWPSVAEAADVLGSALRMRLRLPRPGTESRSWTDAWAVFSVLAPVFMLLTNIVVVLVPPSFLRVLVKLTGGETMLVPQQASWLRMYEGFPNLGAHLYVFYTMLICEAILVVLVLAGRRWVSLAVLVVSALWVMSHYWWFPAEVTLINAGAGILELGALAVSPGPRRGRSLLNWGHGVVVVLVIAAVKLSSIALPAFDRWDMVTTPLLAWVLLLSAGALVVIAGAAAMRLRLGQHALWIGAALLYPYLLDSASIVLGRGNRSDLLGFYVSSAALLLAILFLMPLVMAVLALLIAARARLASSDAGLTPGS